MLSALLTGLSPTIGVLVLLARGVLTTLLATLTLVLLATLLTAGSLRDLPPQERTAAVERVVLAVRF